jgi:hypothetical protein
MYPSARLSSLVFVFHGSHSCGNGLSGGSKGHRISRQYHTKISGKGENPTCLREKGVVGIHSGVGVPVELFGILTVIENLKGKNKAEWRDDPFCFGQAEVKWRQTGFNC